MQRASTSPKPRTTSEVTTTGDSPARGPVRTLPSVRDTSAVGQLETIRVSIVEDDARVRASMARLIDGADRFVCVSQHESGERAIADLPGVRPDVVLMDINLPGMNGVECVRQLKPVVPDTQVVMLTVYEDTDNIFNALAAGATGYLLKRTPPRRIARRHPGSPSRRLADDRPHRPQGGAIVPGSRPRRRRGRPLAARAGGARLPGQGFLYKEIAGKLGISYETVHTYIRRIYEKLQVRTRTEAVAKHLARPGQPARLPQTRPEGLSSQNWRLAAAGVVKPDSVR